MTRSTPTVLLTALRDALAEWARTHGGAVSIAQDPFHVVEMLEERPAGFRVIIHWSGDDPELSPWSGITRNNIEIILSQNRGLASRAGGNLIEPRAGQVALYDLVGELRAHVRQLNFGGLAANTESPFLEYRGTQPIEVPGELRLDAYLTKWALDAPMEAE